MQGVCGKPNGHELQQKDVPQGFAFASTITLDIYRTGITCNFDLQIQEISRFVFPSDYSIYVLLHVYFNL